MKALRSLTIALAILFAGCAPLTVEQKEKLSKIKATAAKAAANVLSATGKLIGMVITGAAKGLSEAIIERSGTVGFHVGQGSSGKSIKGFSK